MRGGSIRRVPCLELNFCCVCAFISLCLRAKIVRVITEFPQEEDKSRTDYSSGSENRESKKGPIWPKVEATLYYAWLIVYLAFILPM